MVVIKMDMPKSCKDCLASKIAIKASGGWTWCCPFEEGRFCEPVMREVNKECFEKRLDNCPLIPLTEYEEAMIKEIIGEEKE